MTNKFSQESDQKLLSSEGLKIECYEKKTKIRLFFIIFNNILKAPQFFGFFFTNILSSKLLPALK